MEALSTALTAIAPFVVVVNLYMLVFLVRKTRRFERVLARYEGREHLKLERDTMEALTLLRTGKIEEAKTIADRIVNA
jgi:hypothetical protein